MSNKRRWRSSITCFSFILLILILFSVQKSYRDAEFDIFFKNNEEIRKEGNYYNTDYAKFLSVFRNRNLNFFHGWQRVDFNDDKNPDFYINKQTGFEATAFKKNNTLVVVIRGMELMSVNNINVFADKDGQNAKEIFLGNLGVPFLGKIPEQFNDTMKFISLAQKKYPDCKTILVGKSLGGGLAQLAGAIKGFETYTFAAPGMQYAISKLDPELQMQIKMNAKRKFINIKNYININDPCGNYGKHIGTTFVHPPMPIKTSMFYDVHGNINHFASKTIFKKIIPLPKDWKFKHTAALVYFDQNMNENIKPIRLQDFIKLRYGVDRKDLNEAKKLVKKYFKDSQLSSNYKTKKVKIVMSNFKSNVN